MGTGKQRISTAARLEAKAEGEPVLELELVLVQAELELVPVVAARRRGPAAALEHVPVVAVRQRGPAAVPELETVPVVAPELAIGPAVVREPETAPAVVRELELVQVALPLRTRSVTAAHRPGLVLHLLVAVAETTREPAAAEAVIAWAVAE